MKTELGGAEAVMAPPYVALARRRRLTETYVVAAAAGSERR